jgi:PAS domain-containing protein
VLAEVARASAAAGAGLWLASPGDRALQLVAAFPGDPGGPVGPGWAAVPRHFADAAAAASWAVAGGWSGVDLPEGRSLGGGAPPGGGTGAVGFLAVRADPDAPLLPEHERYLATVRLELAVTLRAAQLRASLAREQATLAAILEGATDAIVAVDGGRRIVRLNAAAAALVGTPARSGTGMSCSEFLGCARRDPEATREGSGGIAATEPDLLCGQRCPFSEVLDGEPPIVGRELAVRRRDGGAIPVAGSISRMPTPGGGAVAVLRDLRASRVLDEAKTSFVAAISHELRTPLALIDGYTQSLLYLDLDRGTARRHVERMRRAASRTWSTTSSTSASSRATRWSCAAPRWRSTGSCAPTPRSARRGWTRARSAWCSHARCPRSTSTRRGSGRSSPTSSRTPRSTPGPARPSRSGPAARNAGPSS